MSDQFSLTLYATYGENQSPSAEAEDARTTMTEYFEFQSSQNQMRELCAVGIAQGLSAELKTTAESRSHGLFFGGGPIIDHESLLAIGGAITAAIGLIKTARPIIVEYLKSRRSSFTFKHGDKTIELHGPDSIKEIETYLKPLMKEAQASLNKNQKQLPAKRTPQKSKAKKK
jgi:hypothetical protein